MSAQQVTDKPTETGIKLNNILTCLILAAILWVGSSIEEIKVNVAEVTAFQMVNSEKINQHETRLNKNEHRIARVENELLAKVAK